VETRVQLSGETNMKKLTAQFLIVIFAVLTLTATSVYAQKKLLKLKKGTTTVRATIGADKSATWNISGKQFKKLSIKQRGREKFKFEIRRGGEFLSSGHTTGVIRVNSDGESTYSVKIINNKGKARKIVLGFAETGGGSPTI